MSTTKKLDLIIWGATGFTGQLVSKYISKTYSSTDLKWGIAGRNKEKIFSIANKLNINDDRIFIADSNNLESLVKLTSKTKVICTTVGPYAKYGTNLVEACISSGTDYCDITGETQWIRRIIDKYHKMAEQKKIKIPVHSECNVCFGSGAKPGTSPITCPTCNGSGQVRMQQGFFSIQQTCSTCNGEGKIIKDKCTNCNGIGAIKENKTLSVNIPAGVDNGDKVRLAGKGEWLKGGTPGDLYVAIRVKAHPFFERDGKDLYLEVPITFEKSIIGGSIEIPTLDSPISLKIPKQTQTGKVFRIRGKGASSVRDSRRGDILCRVIVETPSNLDRKQIKLLNEFTASLKVDKNYPGSDAFKKASDKLD